MVLLDMIRGRRYIGRDLKLDMKLLLRRLLIVDM